MPVAVVTSGVHKVWGSRRCFCGSSRKVVLLLRRASTVN